MHLVFWAWVTLAALFAIAESVTGGLLVLPWSLGAGTAAALEAVGAPVQWQWIAFAVVSSVLLVLAQRLIVQRRR